MAGPVGGGSLQGRCLGRRRGVVVVARSDPRRPAGLHRRVSVATFAAATADAFDAGGASAAAATDASAPSAPNRPVRDFWSKVPWGALSRVVNIAIVSFIFYTAGNAFLTQSPQFIARWDDLLATRAFSRMSTAFGTLPAQNWAALAGGLLTTSTWRSPDVVFVPTTRVRASSVRMSIHPETPKSGSSACSERCRGCSGGPWGKEHQLTAFPYRTAAILTGVTYALADWTAQSCEGRGPFGFSRLRLLRCCAVGASLLVGPSAGTGDRGAGTGGRGPRAAGRGRAPLSALSAHAACNTSIPVHTRFTRWAHGTR